MNIQTIGPEELGKLGWSVSMGELSAPAIPFVADLLDRHAGTHLLVFAPKIYTDGSPITLNSLRDRFGIDPAISEPCFYNQDWYLKEDFANEPLDGNWHLIRKDVLEDARAKSPEDIEATIPSSERFPSAALYAFAFLAWWFHTGGEKLWKHDFVWSRDRDHNGDRIYVGRYEDPDGINKNGFNIHRHLSLRSAYSAAPEITG
ncbi:hypothetical protein A3A39_02335 [Candidatus Kaiserbacteria bacterium RIFCSPLOWO2_01_FULL_54_13]|uniref:Uncharacterized protein n=1 Tax=Candidatus Kaiserbacteria bacterium RIFCSPLOWO2_01_FULL_54_13 TaxID=1798512 RepID=A0A1F6F128_9BACT|nr:MAG: hypothetical protein A3A39_02335 [Candidatus Kaiserbacteria bacterium RIFCSPLOWO2_01_FULL_54_13]